MFCGAKKIVIYIFLRLEIKGKIGNVVLELFALGSISSLNFAKTNLALLLLLLVQFHPLSEMDVHVGVRTQSAMS